jgi:hypothetical protein
MAFSPVNPLIEKVTTAGLLQSSPPEKSTVDDLLIVLSLIVKEERLFIPD